MRALWYVEWRTCRSLPWRSKSVRSLVAALSEVAWLHEHGYFARVVSKPTHDVDDASALPAFTEVRS